MTDRVLVHGLGLAGIATVRAVSARGAEVIASDDHLRDDLVDVARELGVEVMSGEQALGVLDTVSAFVPAPGVPETHPLVVEALRQEIEVVSEIELAYRFEQERPEGPRPIIAITGTDGKTTTTMLVAAMLEAGGLPALAVGNTEIPMLDALDSSAEVFVVECTSFRLAWTHRFRADAAIWLNLAPDHLNWHRSMASYEAAKARIFQLQRPDDVAIGSADDPVVLRHLEAAPGRRLTFATRDADYSVHRGWLVGPLGSIAPVAAMSRALPHDITNALAAAAAVLELDLADASAVRRTLETFVGPPHRIEFVAEHDGIRWFNDSKATTPHAAAVALRSFESVVLIAGGRNKGLDLSTMALERSTVRHVIAIGEAASEIASAFAGGPPVEVATSMDEAVERARGVARTGDVVLLSPGCASFDWYPDGGFEARGDAFRAAVRVQVLGESEDDRGMR